jgi:hypothetical protein
MRGWNYLLTSLHKGRKKKKEDPHGGAPSSTEEKLDPFLLAIIARYPPQTLPHLPSET